MTFSTAAHYAITMGGKAHGSTEAARTKQHLLIEIGGAPRVRPANRRY